MVSTSAERSALRPPRPWDRQPQWWLWVVALVGWAALVDAFLAVVGPGLGPLVGADGGTDGGTDGGADVGPVVDAAGHDLGPVFSVVDWGAHAVASVAMVAVMAPLIGSNVRFAARRSPRGARGAVTRYVVAGWALVWLGAAAVLGVVGAVLVALLGEPVAIVVVTAVAVAWQCSPPKRRALARSQEMLVPQAPWGYGRVLGRDCVLSCWPLVALAVVAAHDPFVVAAVVGVAWYERRHRARHDPSTLVTALVIVAAGAFAFAVALLLGST